MSLLDKLSDEKCWMQFYEYKTSLICTKQLEKELSEFIRKKEYLSVCNRINSGKEFPIPERSVISKTSSSKKRIVYTYPYAENIVLKLLTYLIIRKYNSLFCDNLYSFRPGYSAKNAVKRLTALPYIKEMYSYKVDISNYFNSVQTSMLIPQLKAVTEDDPKLFDFLKRLLEEEYVSDNGKPIKENKGIMAGTPISSFYANLFLMDLDRYFYEKGIVYARYSDDIIVFARTKEQLNEYAAYIHNFLNGHKLKINADKEFYSDPESGWTFLGFQYRNGIVDISPITVRKIKRKMHRKARALQRWRKRGGFSGDNAAAAFIRIFNRKLLENPENNELTWSYWFFSVINTTESLSIIDRYAQDCIRFLISGTHRKSRFNIRYDHIKSLGYKNLVHTYYAHQKESDELLNT